MNSHTPTVLIVDDSSTNNILLQSALSVNKLNVEIATSGEDALEILKRKNINTVVLDVMMPGMSGFEVLKIIKETPKIAQIPVVIVTGESIGGEREKAEELGASAFFAKPIALKALVTKIIELAVV